MTIFTADGLTLEKVVLGVKYMMLVPVSETAVFEGGRVGVGMMGLHIGN